MSDPKQMLDQLSAAFPEHALERRAGGGGQMFTYVAAETVIRRLNAVAGTWDFRMTGHEWMAPIPYKNGKGDPKVSQVLIVFGELTIPGLGTRSGTGVQAIDPEARGAEDMIKGAMSDCLKKCATQFGVALELYGPDLEAGEIPNNTPPRARTTTQNTVRDETVEEERYPSGVTKKQVRTIGAIANALGLEPEKVKAMHGKPSATELTSAEASALITRLRELETKAKAEQSSMAGLVRNVDRNFA